MRDTIVYQELLQVLQLFWQLMVELSVLQDFTVQLDPQQLFLVQLELFEVQQVVLL